MKKPVLAMLCLLLSFGCSKPAPKSTETAPVSPAAAAGQPEAGSLEDVIRQREVSAEEDRQAASAKSVFQGILPVTIRGDLLQPNHQAYLGEPMLFSELPANPYPGQKIAVVAADSVELYGDSLAPIRQDRGQLWAVLREQGLKAVATIPIGTVLPIYGVYLDPEPKPGDSNDVFVGLLEYRKDLNWFYQTEYQGQKGIVWGAGLRGVGLERGGKEVEYRFSEKIRSAAPEEILRLSYYYSKPEKGLVWVPYVGQKKIEPQQLSRLREQHLAFAQTKLGEDYWVSVDSDDLFSLYLRQIENTGFSSQARRTDPSYDDNHGIPTFITTDLAAHALHLLFDRALAQMEEERLLAALARLLLGLKQAAAALPATGADPLYGQAYAGVVQYLQVAEALLRMAPPPIAKTREYSDQSEPSSVQINETQLLAQYPDPVREELRLILAAGSTTFSPCLRIQLDYAQFKPRGHYTRNEILKAFFRAMQWFAQAALDLDPNKTLPKAEGVSESDLDALHGGMALLLNKLLIDNAELLKSWQSVHEPITYLVGAADDLGPADTVPLLKSRLKEDPREWLTRDGVAAVLAELAPKLRAPRIQGQSVLGGTSSGQTITIQTESGQKELMPATFRLLGQRFSLDSYIFHRLSGHRVPGPIPRNMVKGLDVLALLGSRNAELLLGPELQRNPGFQQAFTGLKQELPALAAETRASFYGQFLSLVSTLAAFDSGSGYYFTQKPLWDTRTLLTSHASWAELRHDTLLYTKRSAAERAGNGDYEPTYTTRDYPMQIHYIEPNIRFFYALRETLRSLRASAASYLPKDYRLKLADFAAIAEIMTSIVEKEVRDQAISDAENLFILDVPSYLAAVVKPPDAGEWTEDEDAAKMAVVADVHADALAGQVLEVATGMPYRLYVGLNDGQGGKRVAVGYTFSYYEFLQPMNDPLDDKAWKAMCYPADREETREAITERLRRYQPDWLQNRIP